MVRPGRARRGRVLRAAGDRRTLAADAPYGELESVKAVSDIYAPAGRGHRGQRGCSSTRPSWSTRTPTVPAGWCVCGSPTRRAGCAHGRRVAYLAGLDQDDGRAAGETERRLDDTHHRRRRPSDDAGDDRGRLDRGPARGHPRGCGCGEPLRLPPGCVEQTSLRTCAISPSATPPPTTRSRSLGRGCTTTTSPALIESIILRSEFLTPYTPYQPEISQGGLQAMFEYQTAICELTGLPVSNASLYEGPSAVASAAYMAKLANGRPAFVVSRGVHPHARQTLATVAHGWGGRVIEVELAMGSPIRPLGRTSARAPARCSSSSRTSSAPSRILARSRRPRATGARCRLQRRPADARHP